MKLTPYIALLALILTVGCGSESDPESGTNANMPEANSADTAEAAMTNIRDGLTNGQPVVAWNALPESYQADVNELIQTFGKNMDAEVWQQATGMIGSVHKLLTDQQDFIFNHPAIAEGESPETSKEGIVQITALMKTILDSAGDLENLKTFDGATFMTTTGAKLATQIEALSKLAPEGPGSPLQIASIADVKFETVASTDSTATLKMIQPDGTEEVQEFVKHEGKWLPKDMVDEWDQKMKEAREGLASLPEQSANMKMQLMGVSGMFNGMLLPLQNAANQEQFNAAVENAMGFAAMMGMGGPQPGFGPGSGPPPTFDDPTETPPASSLNDSFPSPEPPTEAPSEKAPAPVN